MTQAKFAAYIGVSKKTVTLMKQKKQIVMNGTKVDVAKSIQLLKSIGRSFDSKNKMITSNTAPGTKEKEGEKNLLNTEFDYPTLTAIELKAQESREIESLQREAEKEGLTLDKVLTKEINALEPVEINKIKIFWQGQFEKLKYEKEMGILVLKDEVEEENFKISRTVRDSVMGMSNRVAHKLMNKNSIHEIKLILDAETLKIMENLSL